MNCSECQQLWFAFHGASVRFNDARNASFYKISTEVAAYEYVRLQRAKNDLEEHQLACPWANLVDALLDTSEMIRNLAVVDASIVGSC